jgi:hypothetical protein
MEARLRMLKLTLLTKEFLEGKIDVFISVTMSWIAGTATDKATALSLPPEKGARNDDHGRQSVEGT